MGNFYKVALPPRAAAPGTAFLRRQIVAANGETLQLQRIVPLTNGLRGYYHGPKSGLRAIDRTGVSKVVREDVDRVWLA